MSAKIGVWEIIKGNFNTLYNPETQKTSKFDVLTFYIAPILFAILCFKYNYVLDEKLIGHLINASALLSGLLLNLIILVFGLKDKIRPVEITHNEYQLVTLKRSVMKELYYNVCSASVTAFVLLISCIANSVLDGVIIDVFKLFDLNLNLHVVNPVIVFLCIHLFVSFLMIIKRTYRLLLVIQ
jgi:hypothetical protein